VGERATAVISPSSEPITAPPQSGLVSHDLDKVEPRR